MWTKKLAPDESTIALALNLIAGLFYGYSLLNLATPLQMEALGASVVSTSSLSISVREQLEKELSTF